tara:strand:- start:1093 stop:2157 length:1065 start_codon:yes stop_codon:yes gene_type:complete
MNKFSSLEVKSIKRLTLDSVAITFDSLDKNFDFIPGQYITIKHIINDNEVRRSYSISSLPGKNIEIGVKLVKNGLMSTYLTKELKEGDSLEVMPPTGNFYLETDSSNTKHYVGICAGSGITPVLSMIRQVLNNESDSEFTLIYGNKNTGSIMFAEELQLLEQNFQSQFFVHYAFSREDVDSCINGRIDKDTLKYLFEKELDINELNSFYICGPGDMIDSADVFLQEKNISTNNINFERFTASSVGLNDSNSIEQKVEKDNITSALMVTVDGDDFEFSLESNGKSILDAAMEEGADVPFSCKGGVCCVCKAKVIEGEVIMDQNFSLSDDEVNEGFILSCQAHPVSKIVKVDFDEI